MPPYLELKKNKIILKKIESLCNLLDGGIPKDGESFVKLFLEMDQKVKTVFPSVSTGALSNVHGDWYENLISVVAWNLSIDEGLDYVLLPIPKANSFNSWSLYSDRFSSYVVDLKEKVFKSTGARLITSNPDFAIINRKVFGGKVFTKIGGLEVEKLRELNNLYSSCVGLCDLDSLVGFLSVKNSMRPDRRLQICHEGSMMKSVYSHIRTREWALGVSGLKYYAATTKLTLADRNALKTVAGHTLSHVDSLPESSVDGAFSVESAGDIKKMIRKILSGGKVE
jgi:hypothetical protein